MENVTFCDPAHYPHSSHDLRYAIAGRGWDGSDNLYRDLIRCRPKSPGRKGIDKLSSGWLGTSEMKRVRFDPEKVTVQEMESWLKQAGTYIRTVPIENNYQGDPRY